MNKFAVAICVFFVAVCVVEARQCRLVFTGLLCQKQCCGKINNIKCVDSCEYYSCSSNADCGRSECKNGKCGPPRSTGSVKTVSTTIAVVVLTAIVLSL